MGRWLDATSSSAASRMKAVSCFWIIAADGWCNRNVRPLLCATISPKGASNSLQIREYSIHRFQRSMPPKLRVVLFWDGLHGLPVRLLQDKKTKRRKGEENEDLQIKISVALPRIAARCRRPRLTGPRALAPLSQRKGKTNARRLIPFGLASSDRTDCYQRLQKGSEPANLGPPPSGCGPPRAYDPRHLE